MKPGGFRSLDGLPIRSGFGVAAGVDQFVSRFVTAQGASKWAADQANNRFPSRAVLHHLRAVAVAGEKSRKFNLSSDRAAAPLFSGPENSWIYFASEKLRA